MTTGIGNRLLSNPYAGSVLTETKSKAIENKGTQTDQVLDLSGSPEQIAAEISSQDINSIKAIKINNSLVTMSPKQIESLITELKSKCLESDNKLKTDIKFANFQSWTGQNKIEINAVETLPIVSPKSYSSIFRSLYLSSYLSYENSSYLLSILTKTNFKDKIPAGIPADITVAHKIGVFNTLESDQKVYTDCGIVYLPKRPYALCVFVEGSEDSAKKHMSYISYIIYTYLLISKSEMVD